MFRVYFYGQSMPEYLQKVEPSVPVLFGALLSFVWAYNKQKYIVGILPIKGILYIPDAQNKSISLTGSPTNFIDGLQCAKGWVRRKLTA